MSKLRIKIACLFLTIWYFFSLSVVPVLALINYSYDQNGNMLSDGQYCYTYNEANQVSKVKNCSNSQLVAEYLYDYTGRRIVKKEYENGTLKQTTYSPDKTFETKKLPDNSTSNQSYYYINNELVARKNPDGSKVFYHNDHLGSATILTNASGSLIEETSYYPFGEIRLGGTNSKYLFTGQEKDLETGLNYYGARYYNSHIARFTQPDSLLPNPYDPQQLNRYAYTRNNPLKYTDPSGNFLFIPFLMAMGTYATAVTSAPDFQYDMAYLSQSWGDFKRDQSFGNTLSLGADIASIALPGLSGGSMATRAFLKSGGDEAIEKSAKTVMRNADNTVETVKNSKKIRDISNPVVRSEVETKFHGSDLRNSRSAVGYSLRNKATDDIVKIGETLYPSRRYPQRWLYSNNLYLKEEAWGLKEEMHRWQYYKIRDFIDLYGERPLKNRTDF